MSVVLRYLSRSPSSTVALQISGGMLSVVKRVSQDAQAALQRESTALQALSNLQGLPRLFSSGRSTLVRSYQPGLTLRAAFQRRNPPKRQVQMWLDRLARILGEVHSRGFWHGDVSDTNVLVAPDESVVLLDWGSEDWGTPAYRVPGESGPDADWRAWKSLSQQFLGESELAGEDVPRLLGREPIIARLRAWWQEAAQSDGLWIGIEAPSGGGKSAVLGELADWGPQVVQGGCSTLSSPLGYQVFQSLLQDARWPISGEEMTLACWRQFQLSFPGFVDGEAPKAPGASSLTPMLLEEAWSVLLRKSTKFVPTLLLLDDVQWLDTASLDLLERLSTQVLPGLLVVLCWRSEEWSPPQALQLGQRLRLDPLTALDVSAWAARDGLKLDQETIQVVSRWTEGNPLLIREWLSHPRGSFASQRVASLLEKRISEIPASFLPVLQMAAVAGADFSLAPLKQFSHWDAAIEWSLQKQLLRPGPRFSHDRIRETLLERLSASQKREIHFSLAEYFSRSKDPEKHSRCAHHFALAGHLQRAAPHALVAARQNAPRSAQTAAYYYEIFCQSQLIPSVVVEYSQVLAPLGHHSLAQDWLERAQTDSTEPELSAVVASRRAWHFFQCSMTTQGLAQVDTFWRHIKRQKDPVNLVICREVLTLELEFAFHTYRYASVFRRIVRRFPQYWYAIKNDFPFQLTLLITLSYCGVPISRRIRSAYLRKARTLADPEARARSLVRLYTLRFAHPNSLAHRALLEHLSRYFELIGNAWELLMVHMQQGLYAMLRGDLPLLHRLASRLRGLATLTGDRNGRAVALHFEVFATGGRLSERRVLDSPDCGPGIFLGFHGNLGQAQFLIFQGKHELALQRLSGFNSLMPLERGILEAWRATAWRKFAESTPRRWRCERQERFSQAVAAARRSLASGPLARLGHFRAQREMALAMVGLGRAGEGADWLARSVRGARQHAATYEEGLSLLAYSCFLETLEREECELQVQRGSALLTGLGAWWEVSPESSGLPLQEISVDATAYLQSPCAEREEPLLRWAPPSWVERLRETVSARNALTQQWEASSKALSAQQRRWQAFLQQGPVTVKIGQEVESSSLSVEEFRQVISLEDGEQAVMELPRARTKYAAFVQLLDAEVRDLNRLLQQDQRKTKLPDAWPVAEGREWEFQPGDEEMSKWTVDLDLGNWQAIPWSRLGPQGRAALSYVLREGLTNHRKHNRASKIDLQVNLGIDRLQVRLSPQTRVFTGTTHASFGLRSMAFRASLAGARIWIDEGFVLTVQVPLD